MGITALRALHTNGNPRFNTITEELEADEEFTGSKTVPEQYINAFRILLAAHPDPVSYSVLGELFNVDKGTVRKQVLKYQNRLQTILSPGRPKLLNEEQLARLRQEIIDQYEKRNPITITEVAQIILTEFGIHICHNALHHILARDPTIKSCTAIPIETKRAEVTVQQIREHFEHLSASISGIEKKCWGQ
jgi:septum formation topological specificity factor MinE